ACRGPHAAPGAQEPGARIAPAGASESRRTWISSRAVLTFQRLIGVGAGKPIVVCSRALWDVPNWVSNPRNPRKRPQTDDSSVRATTTRSPANRHLRVSVQWVGSLT